MKFTTKNMAELLGRDLTASEGANFEQNLKITINKLEQILCLKTSCGKYTRKFRARKGYKTMYIDPFTSINEVKVGGVVREDYTPTFNGDLNADCFYDAIEFDEVLTTDDIVEVKANWGINEFPYDLQNFTARLFSIVSDTESQSILDNSNVKRKSIDGFSVTYKDSSSLDIFCQENSSVITKYGHCSLISWESSVDVQPL